LTGDEEQVCALLADGAVRCWGLSGPALGLGLPPALEGDPLYAIGDDELPTSQPPVDVGGPVQQIAAGHHTCALLSPTSLRCWGESQNGELGYGNTRTIGTGLLPKDAGDIAVIGPPP
jgi:hypothetical protein